MMKRFILPILLVALLLVSCEPSYERTEGEASYDSVVFIGVDGAGEWLSKAEGFSQVFSSSSAWTGTATSEAPSVSAQNWGSYLHGVSPSVHKCVNASIACERFPYSQYPSVFKILREVYPNATLASFTEWNAINYGLIETSAGVYKSSDRRFCSTVYSTSEIMDMTLEYLESTTPTFLFVHIEDADDAGHGTGYGNEKHLAAVQNDMDFIKKVDAAIDYSRTLLIVATDHGGTGCIHGGSTPEETNITIAVKGKTIAQMKLSDTVTPKDIAPVILKALGVKKPSFMEGDIPEGLTL